MKIMKRTACNMIRLVILIFSCYGTNSYAIQQNDLPHYSIQSILKQANQLDSKALDVGLKAYQQAYSRGLTSKPLLTIVDYSKPSSEERLWVIDLQRNKLLFHGLVSHGQGSGLEKATHFSNKNQTHASSLGVFLTGHAYEGKYGHSMRLRGLEPGFNEKAMQRAIVMHQAWYVSNSFIKEHGYAGRSWGCFALNPSISDKVINTIKDGTIIVAYYPDSTWLAQSKFVNTQTKLV